MFYFTYNHGLTEVTGIFSKTDNFVLGCSFGYSVELFIAFRDLGLASLLDERSGSCRIDHA